jgi:hypothetical protein
MILGGGLLRVLRVAKILRWRTWGTLVFAIGTVRQAPAPPTPAHGRAESEAVKKKRKKKANVKSK